MNNIEIQSRKYFKYQMFEKEFVSATYGDDAFTFKEDWNGKQSLTTRIDNFDNGIVTLTTNMVVGKTYKVSFDVDIQHNLALFIILTVGTATLKYITSRGSYEYSFTATTPNIAFILDDLYGDNLTPFSISNLKIIEDVQENYSVLELDNNTRINISKSLKDIRTPGANGTNWSKEFLIPITPKNSYYFDYYESNDIAALTSIYYHECYIVFDGINNIKGRLYLDSMITNKDGSRYYKVVFLGENANLFNSFKDNFLYNLDTITYGNLNYTDILASNAESVDGEDAYSQYLTGNTGTTMLCYGLLDRGEGLSGIDDTTGSTYTYVINKQPITQATDSTYEISGVTNGLLADSFTPAFYNWWLFTKIHEQMGYSVGGDLFEDSNFLELALPITRKNYWLDNVDELNIDELIISNWNPSTVDFNNFGLNGLLDSGLLAHGYATPNDENQLMILNKYYSTRNSLITPSIPLDVNTPIVRQRLKFNIDIDLTTWKNGSTYYNFKFNLNIYLNQGYGGVSGSSFNNVLLYSFTSPLISSGGAFVDSYYTDSFITDYIAFLPKEDYTDMTHFTYDITISNLTTDGGVSMISVLEFDVNTYVDEEEDTKIRINNIPNAEIGTYSYPKDITYFDFIKDQINMFNLTVDIDENTKTVYYNKWKNILSSGIQDLTQNIILDNTIKKLFTNTLSPYEYNYSFGLDDNDYYTNLSGVNDSAKLITYPVNKRNENNVNVEVNGNFLYDTNFYPLTGSSAGVLYNGLDVKKIFTSGATIGVTSGDTVYADGNINYDFSNLNYAYFSQDYSPHAYDFYNDDLSTGNWSYNIPKFSYTNGDVILSFENVNKLTSELYGNTLYDEYYKEIIELLNAPNSYILEAYFMLNSVEFYNLDLAKKVRVGNSLFLINSIKDWNPNTPTKIELIKITNSNI